MQPLSPRLTTAVCSELTRLTGDPSNDFPERGVGVRKLGTEGRRRGDRGGEGMGRVGMGKVEKTGQERMKMKSER